MKSLRLACVLMLILGISGLAWQLTGGVVRAQQSVPGAAAPPHPLVGDWHYRAYFNDPAQGSTAGFGEGTLRILSVEDGKLVGRLSIRDGGPDSNYFAPLAITGYVANGHPMGLRFRGVGNGKRANGNTNTDWLYDYQGYRLTDDLKLIAPTNGELTGGDERKLGRGPVLVGQVMRVQDHPSDGPEPERAGQVGTWIAVKADW